MDKDGKSAILGTTNDWNEARERAAAMRMEGLTAEIWHENGVKVEEPEDTAKTP